MKAYKELVQSLDHLVKVYRHLLDIVRKENDVLTAADMKEIPVINEAKEKLVYKVKELESQWQGAANTLAHQLRIKSEQPTLLELSRNLTGDEKVKLEQVRSVLTMLVGRIDELNKKNELLVQAAISHISGAMDSITNTLNENPTYKKSGGMKEENKDAQGRLVYKEA